MDQATTIRLLHRAGSLSGWMLERTRLAALLTAMAALLAIVAAFNAEARGKGRPKLPNCATTALGDVGSCTSPE